jgi:D-alanyl-D-alanine endopeptidase (penicillin-binding protein 7)
MKHFRHQAILFVALWSLALPAGAASLNADAGPYTPIPDEFATAIVMVPGSHQVLWSFKPDQTRTAASLTKLANALAFVKSNPSWDRVVSLKASDEVGGGRLRVKAGAQMTVRDLFYSSITASANNAATALSRLSGLKTSAFIYRMNTEANRAGATRSRFVDASGMDPKNQTTARDMAMIADVAFQSLPIRRAAQTMTYRFVVRNTQEKKTLTNTNLLLTQDPDIWVLGGKTGYLEESLYNLVVKVRPVDTAGKPIAGKDVIVVVLGAPTKDGSFASAKRLATWAWQSHAF